MKSFRLHVGERRYLTRAGCLSLFLAALVTLFAGYALAKWLADTIGPGRGMIWIVAAIGLAMWLICWQAFRALGYPLVADLPDNDGSPNETQR